MRGDGLVMILGARQERRARMCFTWSLQSPQDSSERNWWWVLLSRQARLCGWEVASTSRDHVDASDWVGHVRVSAGHHLRLDPSEAMPFLPAILPVIDS